MSSVGQAFADDATDCVRRPKLRIYVRTIPKPDLDREANVVLSECAHIGLGRPIVCHCERTKSDRDRQ